MNKKNIYIITNTFNNSAIGYGFSTEDNAYSWLDENGYSRDIWYVNEIEMYD